MNMGRCNGYRPKKEVRAEVASLRSELAKLDSSQWQRATILQQVIMSLMGRDHGPSNGKIEPRACRFCNYYGHTRQYCPARKRQYDRECEREAANNMEILAKLEETQLDYWSMEFLFAEQTNNKLEAMGVSAEHWDQAMKDHLPCRRHTEHGKGPEAYCRACPCPSCRLSPSPVD